MDIQKGLHIHYSAAIKSVLPCRQILGHLAPLGKLLHDTRLLVARDTCPQGSAYTISCFKPLTINHVTVARMASHRLRRFERRP